ncbi:hypothetical protein ACFL6Y_10045 [Elusimicrobiota bacterium]
MPEDFLDSVFQASAPGADDPVKQREKQFDDKLKTLEKELLGEKEKALAAEIRLKEMQNAQVAVEDALKQISDRLAREKAQEELLKAQARVAKLEEKLEESHQGILGLVQQLGQKEDRAEKAALELKTQHEHLRKEFDETGQRLTGLISQLSQKESAAEQETQALKSRLKRIDGEVKGQYEQIDFNIKKQNNQIAGDLQLKFDQLKHELEKAKLGSMEQLSSFAQSAKQNFENIQGHLQQLNSRDDKSEKESSELKKHYLEIKDDLQNSNERLLDLISQLSQKEANAEKETADLKKQHQDLKQVFDQTSQRLLVFINELGQREASAEKETADLKKQHRDLALEINDQNEQFNIELKRVAQQAQEREAAMEERIKPQLDDMRTRVIALGNNFQEQISKWNSRIDGIARAYIKTLAEVKHNSREETAGIRQVILALCHVFGDVSRKRGDKFSVAKNSLLELRNFIKGQALDQSEWMGKEVTALWNERAQAGQETAANMDDIREAFDKIGADTFIAPESSFEQRLHRHSDEIDKRLEDVSSRIKQIAPEIEI